METSKKLSANNMIIDIYFVSLQRLLSSQNRFQTCSTIFYVIYVYINIKTIVINLCLYDEND
jgi:hypothetical protein